MTTLKTFDFGAAGGERNRYDWAKLLNGEIHELTRGKDFTSKWIRAIIQVHCKAKGIKVRISGGYPHSPKVVLQAILENAPVKKTRKTKSKKTTETAVEAPVETVS